MFSAASSESEPVCVLVYPGKCIDERPVEGGDSAQGLWRGGGQRGDVEHDLCRMAANDLSGDAQYDGVFFTGAARASCQGQRPSAVSDVSLMLIRTELSGCVKVAMSSIALQLHAGSPARRA